MLGVDALRSDWRLVIGSCDWGAGGFGLRGERVSGVIPFVCVGGEEESGSSGFPSVQFDVIPSRSRS